MFSCALSAHKKNKCGQILGLYVHHRWESLNHTHSTSWPRQPRSASTEWYSMKPWAAHAGGLSHAQTSAHFISTHWPALLERPVTPRRCLIWWDWNVNEASRRVDALVKRDYTLMLTAAATESIVVFRWDVVANLAAASWLAFVEWGFGKQSLCTFARLEITQVWTEFLIKWQRFIDTCLLNEEEASCVRNLFKKLLLQLVDRCKPVRHQ